MLLPIFFQVKATSLMAKLHGLRRHLPICVASSEVGVTYQQHSFTKAAITPFMEEMAYEDIVIITVMKVNMW